MINQTSLLKEFTAAERREINRFYATGIGRKTVEKMPILMAKGANLGRACVEENIGELEAIIDAEAKRWGTALGRDSVEGVYTRVDFIEGESAYYAISYRYTVSGKRYFGSISRSHLLFGLFSTLMKILRN